MLALAAVPSWINWPFSPGEITISPNHCPPLASGAYQAADAALRVEGWQTLFLFVFLSSVVAALVMVLLAYAATRRIGMPFVRRWLTWLGVTGAIAAVAAAALLLAVPVATSGCEAGEAVARVPAGWMALRSLLAAVHGTILYVLLSWLLSTVLGRVLRQGRWYDNHRVPYPALLPRRQG
ncbi:MAG TPA: hypothetical protein VFJ16_28075 [Longimicrobium sp.]|nr:hypothetical protein [Longimicrobium sp.]